MWVRRFNTLARRQSGAECLHREAAVPHWEAIIGRKVATGSSGAEGSGYRSAISAIPCCEADAIIGDASGGKAEGREYGESGVEMHV